MWDKFVRHHDKLWNLSKDIFKACFFTWLVIFFGQLTLSYWNFHKNENVQKKNGAKMASSQTIGAVSRGPITNAHWRDTLWCGSNCDKHTSQIISRKFRTWALHTAFVNRDLLQTLYCGNGFSVCRYSMTMPRTYVVLRIRARTTWNGTVASRLSLCSVAWAFYPAWASCPYIPYTWNEFLY